MSTRKICLLIPSLQAGGMERVMAELANYLCRKNELEVHIILYGKKIEIFYNIADKIVIHKPVNLFKDKYRLFCTVERLIYIRRKIKSIKPDSILSFGEYWNSFVLIAVFGLNIPIFISDRCQPDKNLGLIHDLLRRILYPGASGIIVQTRKAKSIYSKMFPAEKIVVIGNPIRSIDAIPDSEKEDIVLSVGMLINCKNFDGLIRTFAEINKQGWKLMIAGDDAMKQENRSKLELLAKELNCDDNIILSGLVSDVDSLYRKSRIFVFTSSSEGFPNVVGEAMSAGLPVISFDCTAGPSEMINDGKDGLLVPLSDYELLKEKIRLLMEDAELRKQLGDEARKSIKRFSPDKIGEEFYSLISVWN